MEFNVNGKTAVVTGSSRGLGYTFVEALIVGGAARVYINSRKEDACVKAAEKLKKFAKTKGKSTDIVPIASGVNNLEGVRKLVDGVLKNGDKKIDILIANAGASWGASLDSHPDHAISKVLELNVKGVFITIQQFIPLLQKPVREDVDPSRILVTSSIAGLYASKLSTTYGYVASKAGITHLSKVLAIQLPDKYNINVNVLSPGFFPSKMANGLLEVFGEEYVSENPRKRLGKDSDLVPLILFLLDKKTSYINGAVIPVDGGYHLLGPKL